MKTVKLGDIVTVSKGKKHEVSTTGRRYIQIEDVRGDSNIKFTSTSSGTAVTQEDLIIVWDGAYSGLVGYGLNGVIGSTLARLTLTQDNVHTPFLGHYLQSKFNLIQSSRTGATIPHVSKSALLSIEIPLPPLKEQKRIAAILDKADALRQKRKAAIELTETFLRSVFLEMFGDPVTNPKGWKLVPLGKLISRKFQNGAYFPKEEYSESDEGIEMVHMSDAFYDTVQFDKIKKVKASKDDLNRYALCEDDILVARRSLNYEGAAKPCRIPKIDRPLIFESSLIRVSADTKRLNPLYLYYYLSNPRVRSRYLFRKVTRSTISGINQSGLSEVDILLPPIEAQNRFVKIHERIDVVTAKHVSNETLLSDLFASISKILFSSDNKNVSYTRHEERIEVCHGI